MHLPSCGATILLLAVAGCAGSPPVAIPGGRIPTPTPTGPTAALTTTPPPNPSPNCGHARVAGSVVIALPGGRRALFTVPPGDDGYHRLPLVIALPGYGRTSEELAAQSRIPARAMAAGVLAVLPQGAGHVPSWNLSGTKDNGDVSFLSALVTKLAATECADPARVAITGISDGGDMAVFAACAMPGTFQAVVTVAASINPRAGCRRLRIVAVHGDADPVNPYRGKPGPPRLPCDPARRPGNSLLGCPRRLPDSGHHQGCPASYSHHVPLRRAAGHHQRWRSHLARGRACQPLARGHHRRVRRHGHNPCAALIDPCRALDRHR